MCIRDRVNEILYKALAAAMNGARSRPGQCDEVQGMEWVDKVIGIDQSPIGRTPLSLIHIFSFLQKTLYARGKACYNQTRYNQLL